MSTVDSPSLSHPFMLFLTFAVSSGNRFTTCGVAGEGLKGKKDLSEFILNSEQIKRQGKGNRLNETIVVQEHSLSLRLCVKMKSVESECCRPPESII